MSTLQLAHDDTNTLVVEWNKYPPHYRVVTRDGHSRGYHNADAAFRAAKRLCRKLNLVLKNDQWQTTETGTNG